jgi:predicted RNA-binding protein associated with RNAse of E/G family
MKSGTKTSEFYVTVLVSVLGVAVSCGLITPEQSSATVASATQIAGAIVTAAAAFGYNISRGIAKRNQVK